MVRRKRYSAEFRVEAVQLYKQRLAAGMTPKRIGDELDVRPDRLRTWASEVDQAPPGTAANQIFPGLGRKRSYTRVEIKSDEVVYSAETPEAELKRLRRENERLRQERDFLKKAAAFFAKESQ